jgi:hypothetical protein
VRHAPPASRRGAPPSTITCASAWRGAHALRDRPARRGGPRGRAGAYARRPRGGAAARANAAELLVEAGGAPRARGGDRGMRVAVYPGPSIR